ncbi:hypothetical protein [Laspinema olomoucense]|uniref:Uncharacterized protein n=1 Tax=Laspinema olomoucense D3b TaxID=2953688 RepID=A0ABT2NF89_9CYAN|nr:hypothetical protein [Laspinema sp. D3b]MCT7981370.1 hypothetical protein [Laspinema sp. D3b]
MDRSLVFHHQTPEISVKELKKNWENQPLLKPEQVKVGRKEIMTRQQREEFWRNSPLAERLGFTKEEK